MLKCWYGSSSSCSSSKHTHTHLEDYIGIPDVSLHGDGTALHAPGGQGQLGVELLHVGALDDGCQGVGATAQDEVAEGGVGGGHVRREEVALNLRE